MFMSEPFIGEIRIVPFDYAPHGWALCNGQTLKIMENQALFSLLGNNFGGDGRTTFALPDLRGRVAIHSGQGTGLSVYTLGRPGGAETVVPNPKGAMAVPVANGTVPSTSAIPGLQPISVVQPYLALNFIIALEGIYPARD
jgi:microcystin-dependent protein